MHCFSEDGWLAKTEEIPYGSHFEKEEARRRKKAFKVICFGFGSVDQTCLDNGGIKAMSLFDVFDVLW